MKVLITDEAYLKLQAYIDLCEYEISGMGKVKIVDENTVLVEDVRLWKQKVTGTTSDLDQDTEPLFINELLASGENPNDWKLWWHSHADMNVFWSPTDIGTIKEIMKVGVDGKRSGLDFLLSIVGNKKAEFRARIDAAVRNDLFGIKGIETRDNIPFERLLDNETENKIVNIEKKISKQKEKIDAIQEIIKELELEIDNMLSVEEDESIVEKCEQDISEHVEKPTYNYFLNKGKYEGKI